MGSEKGTPSSITSARSSASFRQIASEVSRSGSPAVTNGMNPFRPCVVSWLLIRLIAAITGRPLTQAVLTLLHRMHILVASARQIHDHHRLTRHFRCDLDRVRHGMRALEG